MELICLDTNILIAHRRSKDRSKSLLFQLASQYELAITSISVFELWRGDNSGEDAYWEKLFAQMTILELDIKSAKIAGKDYLTLRKKGQMIDIEDLLISGIAKKNNLKIASKNTKHFSRIKGVSLVSLEEEET